MPCKRLAQTLPLWLGFSRLPLGSELVVVCAALLPAWPAALILTALLLGGAILGQQVILCPAGNTGYTDHMRGLGPGTAVATGQTGSLAGPWFSAALLTGGRGAIEALLTVLPSVGACRQLVSRTGISSGNDVQIL